MRKLNRRFVKKVKIFLLLLVIVLVLVLSVKYFFKNDFSSNGSISYDNYVIERGHSGKLEKYDPSHTVEGYKGGKDQAYYITGRITSKVDKGFILITFNLYDQNNKVLGTAVAGLSAVKKDKTYDFKALSLIESKYNDNIDHYKLKEIK